MPPLAILPLGLLLAFASVAVAKPPAANTRKALAPSDLKNIEAVAVRGKIAYARSNITLYKSLDAGRTWTQVTDKLNAAGALAVTANSVIQVDEDRVFRSDDQGKTWRELSLQKFPYLLEPDTVVASDTAVAAVARSDNERRFAIVDVKKNRPIYALEGKIDRYVDRAAGGGDRLYLQAQGAALFQLKDVLSDGVMLPCTPISLAGQGETVWAACGKTELSLMTTTAQKNVWRSVTPPVQRLTGSVQLAAAPGLLYLAVQEPEQSRWRVFGTSDAGATWSELGLVATNRCAIHALADGVLAVQSDGVLVRLDYPASK